MIWHLRRGVKSKKKINKPIKTNIIIYKTIKKKLQNKRTKIKRNNKDK